MLLKDNIKRDEIGRIESVLCWICGTKVAGWVDDDIKDVKSVGNQTQMVVRQKFRSLANYRKVLVTLETGELYSPIVCATCAPKCNEDHIIEILQNDMVLQRKQGLDKKLSDKFAKKKIRKIERIVKSQGVE